MAVPEVGVGLLVRPRGRLDAPVAGLPEPAAVASGAVDLLVVSAQMQRVRVQLAPRLFVGKGEAGPSRTATRR